VGAPGASHLGTRETADLNCGLLPVPQTFRQPVATPHRRPLRFDLDNAEATCRVVAKTRPWPILRSRNQSAHHRVAVHVAELLNALRFVVHEKVVVPRLPEGPLRAPHCHRELERVNYAGNRSFLWLADEQMHVLGHHNKAGYHEAVTSSHALQRILEKTAHCRRTQMLQPVVTTESEKVKITRVFVTDQSSWHWWKAYNKPQWMSKGNRVPRFCCPGCPNARHPGHPSLVGELTSLPPAPGPPASDSGTTS